MVLSQCRELVFAGGGLSGRFASGASSSASVQSPTHSPSTASTLGRPTTACRRTSSAPSTRPATATCGSRPPTGWCASMACASRLQQSNSPGINSNRFSSLYEDHEGALWVGTENGGLTRYFQGHFQTWTTQHGLATNYIKDVSGDEHGSLWVVSGSQIMRLADDNSTPSCLRCLLAALSITGAAPSMAGVVEAIFGALTKPACSTTPTGE